MEIRLSSVDELKNSFELFKKHYDELEPNKESLKVSINIEHYKKLEEEDCLLILAVFENERIIGYSVNYIITHPHYRDDLVCNNDSLFLSPKNRLGSLGIRLVKATEKYAKMRGCKVVMWGAKEGSTFSKLLPILKYKVNEIIYDKEV